MIELLRRAPPARAAIVTDDTTTSYGDLAKAAQAFAAGLHGREVDRFAVLVQDAATVVALLAAASLTGAQACQYPPLDDAGAVGELARRFAHELIVSEHGCAGVDTVRPDALAGRDATPSDPPVDRPHLVLTTGTTGAPRGVCHDWTRLLRSVSRVGQAPEQRWLLAYGLHQFAGLQVLLHVVAAGATLIAPTPRRPREGLAAMRAHRVDHASATPTYWRFLLTELRADGGPPPELRQITLGGEAIPAPLLGELATTFPEARISQIYAASEFGSSGSTRDGRHGLSHNVLERGADADVNIKIVDGELWVRSHNGMLGYYGEAQIDPDAWRPTGDLVEVTDDRILFRGRTSEIINVGGVKVHPLPIEDRIGAVAGVDMARVYGRPSPLVGTIVAAEIVAAPGGDTDAIAAAVRTACSDLPAAARPRSIRFVDSVAMIGQKIVRRSP